MLRRMPRYAKKDLGVRKGGEGVVHGFEGVGIEEGSEAAGDGWGARLTCVIFSVSLILLCNGAVLRLMGGPGCCKKSNPI